MKIDVSGIGVEDNISVESILRKCEYEEDEIHKQFAVLLNILSIKYNVDMNIVSELEDLYIEKGYIYCETFIKLRHKFVNMLTERR